MNAYTERKRIDLDGDKKTVLMDALAETADTMDAEMRRIYDATREQVAQAGGKTILTAAQANIVRFALEDYERRHGQEHPSSRILLQLSLTRKDYARAVALG